MTPTTGNDCTIIEDVLSYKNCKYAGKQRIENCQFSALYDSGSLADHTRILSILSVHVFSWLQAVPSPRLGFDMAPNEMQWCIKWWLGLPLTPEGEVCAYRPDKALDAHHAVTCKFGGDVVARHNTLRNAIFEFYKRALLNQNWKLVLVWVMKGGLPIY